MNPQQQAIQQQDPQQSTDPSVVPSVLDTLKQRVDQGATDLDQERAKTQADQEQSSVSAASRAMAILKPNSQTTQVQVGKAIASPAYAGYCQQFVDDQTGATQRYPSAAATWNAKVQQGQANTDLSKMKPGDVVEFAPDSSNGNMGHAALVQKNGDLKMATYNGVQTFSLKDWTTHTGQVPQGFYSPSK